MPHLLELFCGTKSVGKVFEERGWKVTSVDFDPQFKPTICMNVLDLEPYMIEGNVDLVWASPLCTHYSRARTTARTPRDLEGSDALVRKCLDLADRLFCHYFIENPESGLLKTRDVVAGIPYRVVDYCVYADERFAHRARKRTALWTNTNWKPSRPLCNKDCGHCVGNRHLDHAQRGGSATGRRHSLHELYSMPPALVEDIADWAAVTWPQSEK